jgi:hypothetical protein
MKQKDVVVGETYYAKVSGRLSRVKILSEHHSSITKRIGWNATNLETNRLIYIKSAMRLTVINNR